MEIFYIGIVIFIMVSITVIYFFVGYKFIKKHKEERDGNN